MAPDGCPGDREGRTYAEVLSFGYFYNGENIVFDGDKTNAIQKVAQTLVTACATDSFAVSFMTSESSFPRPDGRSRLFMQDVGPKNVDAVAAMVDMENPQAGLVFMCNTNDTRYDAYSVMRPVAMAIAN